MRPGGAVRVEVQVEAVVVILGLQALKDPLEPVDDTSFYTKKRH